MGHPLAQQPQAKHRLSPSAAPLCRRAAGKRAVWARSASAFTRCQASAPGSLFLQASSGALFLGRIAYRWMQPKLTRLAETQGPTGRQRLRVAIETRLITATNRDLESRGGVGTLPLRPSITASSSACRRCG